MSLHYRSECFRQEQESEKLWVFAGVQAHEILITLSAAKSAEDSRSRVPVAKNRGAYGSNKMNQERTGESPQPCDVTGAD
jgi:hypothetical protein